MPSRHRIVPVAWPPCKGSRKQLYVCVVWRVLIAPIAAKNLTLLRVTGPLRTYKLSIVAGFALMAACQQGEDQLVTGIYSLEITLVPQRFSGDECQGGLIAKNPVQYHFMPVMMARAGFWPMPSRTVQFHKRTIAPANHCFFRRVRPLPIPPSRKVNFLK